jgi:hypothetical protein
MTARYANHCRASKRTFGLVTLSIADVDDPHCAGIRAIEQQTRFTFSSPFFGPLSLTENEELDHRTIADILLEPDKSFSSE